MEEVMTYNLEFFHEIRFEETNFYTYIEMCISLKVLVNLYSQRKNVYESIFRKNVHESIWRWRSTNLPKDKTKQFQPNFLLSPKIYTTKLGISSSTRSSFSTTIIHHIRLFNWKIHDSISFICWNVITGYPGFNDVLTLLIQVATNVEGKILQCKNTKSHIEILNIMEENLPCGRKIMQGPKWSPLVDHCNKVLSWLRTPQHELKLIQKDHLQ